MGVSLCIWTLQENDLQLARKLEKWGGEDPVLSVYVAFPGFLQIRIEKLNLPQIIFELMLKTCIAF